MFPKPRLLTLAQQHLQLQLNPVSAGGVGNIQKGQLDWRGFVSPTALSREYHARIEYRIGLKPKVFIESPNLSALAGGKKIPHLYSQDPAHLCLFFPKFREWSATDRLDKTVIPWAILWLYYFEDWLRDGVWRGGGIHPDGSMDNLIGASA